MVQPNQGSDNLNPSIRAIGAYFLSSSHTAISSASCIPSMVTLPRQEVGRDRIEALEAIDGMEPLRHGETEGPKAAVSQQSAQPVNVGYLEERKSGLKCKT